jgi:hypothetical protein
MRSMVEGAVGLMRRGKWRAPSVTRYASATSPFRGGITPQILPGTGRGTIRRMVEGHALAILTFWRGDTLNVPLHRLRRSPSPFWGGNHRTTALKLNVKKRIAVP